MTPLSIYRVVVSMARHDGWKVRECKMPNSAFGDIDIEKRLIRIDKSQTYSRKLTTLAHEYFGHASQYEDVVWLAGRESDKTIARRDKSRIAKYYSYLVEYDDHTPYTAARMKVVQYCEVDASKRARKWLFELFPKTVDMFKKGELVLEELDERELPSLREAWRVSVFAKDDKK